MLNQRIAAATKVAKELYESEAAVDGALASLARLQASLPEARRIANLSPVMGQDVVAQISRSMANLVQVRGAVVDVHAKLDEIKTDIGLREMAMGGLMQKQPLMGSLSESIDIAA
jgi:phosphoglycerate-specific signal transduction histidine kinase